VGNLVGGCHGLASLLLGTFMVRPMARRVTAATRAAPSDYLIDFLACLSYKIGRFIQ
jgi:hypothetical protein